MRQLVLLGAGFDARGLRLPEVAATRTKVFEVDVPMQIERRARWLAEAGIVVPPAVAGVPFDFEVPDFEDALGRALGSAASTPTPARSSSGRASSVTSTMPPSSGACGS